MASGGRLWGVTVAVGLMVTASGCGLKGGGGPVAAPGGSAPAATSVAATTATATPAAAPPLPKYCSDVLSLTDRDQAVGKFLPGQTVYIKGQAEPKIHRTGRVTCRYAVHTTGSTTVVPIEVGVSNYADAASAADRVQVTVDQQRAVGASATEVTVTGLPATVLVAPDGSSLVLAQGARTVAISITPDVAGPDRAVAVLTALGEAAMSHLS